MMARAKAAKQAQRERLRTLSIAIKESTPCADCGRFGPYYCMDFDHLDSKVADVSWLVSRGVTEVRFREEVAKCEVVCAWCHRIRTHLRSNPVTATIETARHDRLWVS